VFTFIAGLLLAVRLAPADPIADRLVASALETTPEIAAARATADAARLRIAPARTLPDPSVTFQYENAAYGVMLMQPIPWPGKLSLAGEVAHSEARELEAGMVPRAALTIEARVRNTWYELVLARALDQLIEERRRTATQIEESVRSRYAAGLAVQQDVLRAQVELARLDETSLAQQATIAAKLAELHRLVGRDAPIEGELPSDTEVPPADDVIAAALGRSPEVAAARAGIETGRIAIDLAKKNFLPDFVVSGGEMDAMWQFSAGISIPAWIDRRQRNQLAEAHARVAARTAESEVVARELEVRTRERLAQLDAARRTAALYREKIVPLDELALESALASYQAGQVPFVSVLDALNALFSDRAQLLGKLAENARWRIAIDEVMP